MATSKEVAGETEGLMHLLEQTIHAKVLKDLENPLAEILHIAVRDGIIAASKSTPAHPARVAKTTVSRPASGGRCAKVWDELDKLAAKGKEPVLKDVNKLAERKSINSNTARIQFYRWRSARTQPQAGA